MASKEFTEVLLTVHCIILGRCGGWGFSHNIVVSRRYNQDEVTEWTGVLEDWRLWEDVWRYRMVDVCLLVGMRGM